MCGVARLNSPFPTSYWYLPPILQYFGVDKEDFKLLYVRRIRGFSGKRSSLTLLEERRDVYNPRAKTKSVQDRFVNTRLSIYLHSNCRYLHLKNRLGDYFSSGKYG